MYKEIFIIGAPRSGTNMLRDILGQLDGMGTWPCDEINYIFRHGNLGKVSDVFTPKDVTDKNRRYITGQFDKLRKRYGFKVIIEKTCANSLRVGFLNEIFPEAKFIFIVRDGLDVIGSAKLRWTAKLDIPYLLRKLRYVPFSDIPYYGVKYFSNRMYRFFSTDSRLAFWGPQLDEMQSLLKKYSLLEVCALQWKGCLCCAEKELNCLDDSRVLNLRYEKFVTNPLEELKRITGFLDTELSRDELEALIVNVTNKSIGKGRNSLSSEQREKVMPHISDELYRMGYVVD